VVEVRLDHLDLKERREKREAAERRVLRVTGD
jgi:hypothetical protein